MEIIKIFHCSQIFQKVERTMDRLKLRRPDLSYGVNYSKKFNSEFYGPFNLNLTINIQVNLLIGMDLIQDKKVQILLDLSIKKKLVWKYYLF